MLIQAGDANPACRRGASGARTPRHHRVAHWLGDFLRILVLVLLGNLSNVVGASYEPTTIVPPALVREIRGAWVATVGNIDWPSTNGLSTAQQKAELVALLDRAVELKLNTIVFQVRPACDALYASKIEPWSEYLTGAMGKAPEPFYDPLAFAVDQAHKRGLELHAWFNPYRARFSGAKSPVAPTHVSKLHPQWMRRYGSFLWLDPGLREVQDYSLRVVMDVVNRYDIDGVHFDDYFYPYKEKDAAGNYLSFPDELSWRRFGAAGKLTREDWRRENVNRFIERVYRSIKGSKPWVKFGVSPFGIWRPLHPAPVRGMDAYADLYADSRKWLNNGWVDYFAPQLYWSIDSPGQSFPVLLRWWSDQNLKGRQLLAGLNSVKANNEPPAIGGANGRTERWDPEEIIRQIRMVRKQPGTAGHLHWNMRSLMRNALLDSALEREVYGEPVLVPPMPWLSRGVPAKPVLLNAASGASGKASLRWSAAARDKPAKWLIQARIGGKWTSQIVAGTVTGIVWGGSPPELVALSAVNRYGALGPSAAVQLVK